MALLRENTLIPIWHGYIRDLKELNCSRESEYIYEFKFEQKDKKTGKFKKIEFILEIVNYSEFFDKLRTCKDYSDSIIKIKNFDLEKDYHFSNSSLV